MTVELGPEAHLRLVRWLLGRDTGASSKAIVQQLLFGDAHPGHYPADSGDLRRCFGLLTAVPELRPHLNLMRPLHPVWAGILDNLPKLERQLGTRSDGRSSAMISAFLYTLRTP